MAQNIEMQCKQSDGSYETLLPKTQASLLEINNTDLGNHLGGNTTVEGSLDYLSRMYAYWWKREIKTSIYKLNWTQKATSGHYYFLPENNGVYKWDGRENGYIGNQYCDYQYARKTVSYGDQLTIDSNGVIQKSRNWSSYTILSKYNQRYDKISVTPSNVPRTNYICLDGEYYSASSNGASPNTSLYATAAADQFNTAGWKMQMASDNGSSIYKITSILDHVDTITDYVFSFERNAYSDSRTIGQYTYTYLGIPFENAMKDGPK